MRSFLVTVFLTLAAVTANAASITNATSIIYDVNRTIGDGTVTGFITTDGTIGQLLAGNIKDWSLTLTAPDLNGGIPDVINRSAGSTIVGKETVGTEVVTAVTATETQLLYDFTLTGGYHILLMGASGNFWCLETSECSGGPDMTEQIGRLIVGGSEALQFEPRSDVVVFANVAVVPVPAAIWLFGSGLIGLIGLAGRTR